VVLGMLALVATACPAPPPPGDDGTPPEWVVSNVAGACQDFGYVDGLGEDARFSTPASIAQGTDGTLYVADRTNNALRAVDPVTGAVSTFADGLDLPGGVAVDGDDNVYVSSSRNIYKISNGVMTQVRNSLLNRVADPFDVDEDGNLYFFSGVDLVRVDPNGVWTTLLAEVGGGSLAVDVDGTVYFQGGSGYSIHRFKDGVQTFVAGSTLGFADGTGSDAKFSSDMGLDVFEGTVYVADGWNNRVRTVSPEGVVTTIAGSSIGCSFGTGAEAQFAIPYGVVRDPSGDLHVAVGGGPLVARMTQSP
jgi:sugar lactone lactonase YvrE